MAGKKNQVQLPGASKFCSWVSENRSSLAQWASEISLSSIFVSLKKNASMIKDYFQSEVISKLQEWLKCPCDKKNHFLFFLRF